MPALLSKHFSSRSPSVIRQAQITFAERPDRDHITVINMAIGNVSLPMHPAMRERLATLSTYPSSPFIGGINRYTASVGEEDARNTFLHLLSAAGIPSQGLHCMVTDGGSQAMELMILGTCGPASKQPLLLIDPAYTNYVDMAKRCAVKTISIRREIQLNGTFASPDLAALERVITQKNPAALVVIPADNPTGQFLSQEKLLAIATLAVKHNIWLVSDEAYRQLHYNGEMASSIWRITEAQLPGILGRRISVESASKMWNACGLRIGGLITDNLDFHQRAVAEYTANLSSNGIGQYLFAALKDQTTKQLNAWYEQQRGYYAPLMGDVAAGLRKEMPGIIVSDPEAALYAVIDLRNLVDDDFDASDFVQFCAAEGDFKMNGKQHTLLLAPMCGFYTDYKGVTDTASKQMRIAYVATPEQTQKVPKLLAGLLKQYLRRP